MTNELIALLDGKKVGHLRKGARGRVTFVYSQAWREAQESYPLSLSMPLAAQEHGPAVVEAFLWGLLPDNEAVLGRWAAKFQISARNAFALISNVGEDCAGAVQFILPDRLEAVESGSQDSVEWLDDAAIAERMQALREDHAAWRLPRDTGQFSLAGAQPKTALLLQNGHWGIPHGRIPTTHILKPPTGQFDGHAENEHICLSLARALGLPAASSKVMHFDNEVAVVVERYDRQQSGNTIVRVHQEDMCQALGIMPTQKYQNEGGPSVATIVELLRTQSSDREADVKTFVNSVAFNWLIAGTDAHAKNYSLLIANGPRVRLAPLYDIASVLPYKEFDFPKLKLSMKIGGEYEIRQISLRQWQKLSAEIRINADELLNEIRTMADRLPDEVQRARAMARKEGLEHGLIDRLAEALTERAATCRRMFS
jgi:serine/threonine-protein kinase HipA